MVVSEYALRRLHAIHALSREYNGREGQDHKTRLLEMMRHHIDEIEALCAAGDKHALVETGDLIVLCFELIIEHGLEMDAIMERCFDRYDKKLSSLLQAIDPKGETNHDQSA